MRTEADRMRILGEEPVKPALLKLGLPTLVGLAVSALYNVVDAFFVGRLGAAQMAAVSVAAPLSTAMLGLSLLFGAGAASYLSRLLGAGRCRDADACATTALVTAVAASAVLMAAFLLFLEPCLAVLGATDAMMPYAVAYAVPYAVSLVVYTFNATANNIVSSEGATTVGMGAMLLGGVANMALDPLLIYAAGMGVAGAGVATLVGTLLTAGVYVAYIARGRSSFAFGPRALRPSARMYAEVAKIGLPNLAYQLLAAVSLALTNVFAAPYGEAAVAALGIVARVMNLASMVAFGFIKGCQPFVGFNYGAGRLDRVRAATRTALVWETCYAVGAAAVLIALRSFVMDAFGGGDPAVAEVGTLALTVNALGFTTFGIQAVHSAFFLALGKAKEGGLISLGRQGIFFIPTIVIGSAFFGLDGVIAAQPVGDILSTLLVVVLVVRSKGLVSCEEALQERTVPAEPGTAGDAPGGEAELGRFE